jgi:hypothetical protein
MLSGISLVAITLLALMNRASRAMDHPPAVTTAAHQQEEWALAGPSDRETSGHTSDVSAVTDVTKDDDKEFGDVQDVHDAQSKTEVQERGNQNSDLLVTANAK